jgi:hypothetical protein
MGIDWSRYQRTNLGGVPTGGYTPGQSTKYPVYSGPGSGHNQGFQWGPPPGFQYGEEFMRTNMFDPGWRVPGGDGRHGMNPRGGLPTLTAGGDGEGAIVSDEGGGGPFGFAGDLVSAGWDFIKSNPELVLAGVQMVQNARRQHKADEMRDKAVRRSESSAAMRRDLAEKFRERYEEMTKGVKKRSPRLRNRDNPFSTRDEEEE